MSVTNSQNKWLHSATPLLPATVHRISMLTGSLFVSRTLQKINQPRLVLR